VSTEIIPVLDSITADLLGAGFGWDCTKNICLFFVLVRQNPQCAMAFTFTRFLEHTQRRNTVGKTPLV